LSVLPRAAKQARVFNLLFVLIYHIAPWKASIFPLFSRGGLFSALFEEPMEICFSLCYNKCVYTKSIAKGEMSA